MQGRWRVMHTMTRAHAHNDDDFVSDVAPSRLDPAAARRAEVELVANFSKAQIPPASIC